MVLCRSFLVALAVVAVRAQMNGRTHDNPFHPLFLRMHDPALITGNGQRLFEISDLLQHPRSYEVSRQWLGGDGALRVEWADGHVSSFSAALLERWGHEETSDGEESFLWSSGFLNFLPRLSFSGEGDSLNFKRLASGHLVKHAWHRHSE